MVEGSDLVVVCFQVVMVVVVDRGISCGGQSVFMYVVVVLGVGLRWQIMVVVVSSSGGCGSGVK